MQYPYIKKKTPDQFVYLHAAEGLIQFNSQYAYCLVHYIKSNTLFTLSRRLYKIINYKHILFLCVFWLDFLLVFHVIKSFFQRRFSRKGNDALQNLQSQIHDVRDVMTQNIEKVLERGERLDDLMDKTEELEACVCFKTNFCLISSLKETVQYWKLVWTMSLSVQNLIGLFWLQNWVYIRIITIITNN